MRKSLFLHYRVFIFVLFTFLISPLSVTYSQDAPTEPPVEIPTDVPTLEPTLELTAIPTFTEIPTLEPTTTETPFVEPTLTETPTLEPSPTSETVEPTIDVTTIPGEITATVEVTETATIEATLTETPSSTLPTEPSLVALLADNFDGGSLANWTLGEGWGLVANEGGQALQLSGSDSAIFWVHEPVMDTAVEARLLFSAGTVIVNVQQSTVGGYSAQFSADGRVALYRAGTLLGEAVVNPNDGQWRSIRLSTAGDTVRVAVDGVEVIAVQDDAPLPPGIVSLAGSGVSGLLVDDVIISAPDTGLRGVQVSPTPQTEAGIAAPPIPLTYIVNNNGDGTDAVPGDGNCLTAGTFDCTLRAAIQEANAHAGADFINFNMAGNNVIQPATALPAITQAVTINGTTNPGFVRVELDGVLVASGNGLQINAGPTTIIGMVIYNFDGTNNAGIFISGGSNTIQNNLIGVNAAGTGALPNFNGIQVNSSGNLIGDNNFNSNVISGNLGYGVLINGTAAFANWVKGNFVGTTISGVAPLGNGLGGVRIVGARLNRIGGNTPGMGNTISGNLGDGVIIEGAGASGNLVEANIIGVAIDGATAVGNAGFGVQIIDAPNNVIGGNFATVGNLISNNLAGIAIFGSSPSRPVSGNRVQGNFIGTDAAGTGDLGNVVDGVVIFAARNTTIGGTIAGLGNVISGNDQHGIFIDQSTTTLVQGNIIGLDESGINALPNVTGIEISGGSNNTIGGTAAGARNVISGNDDTGVLIVGPGTSGNFVLGNFIGTDVTGTLARPNADEAVNIIDSPNNTIGGTAAGARNLISGNAGRGVIIEGATSSGNRVQGNFIGTNVTGTDDLGNGSGVRIFNAPNNTIGGTVAGARNLISGNSGTGIVIQGATASGNIVQGNFIGTDVTGTLALSNGDGVLIMDAPNNTIGGTVAGTRNIISGNDEDGVNIVGATASGNRVQGNFIGTNAAGTDDLGNGEDGVFIFGAPNNIIGGTVAGARNIISGNSVMGIEIVGTAADGNLIQGNLIGTDVTGTLPVGDFTNGGLQIIGILISDGSDNVVGGTVAGARNIIANAVLEGVRIQNTTASGNRVQGNYIGMNVTGTAPIPNFGIGVFIISASGNTVGGTVAGARNLISGNNSAGVVVDNGFGAPADSNVIQGNYIGTDVTGTLDPGNTNIGILLRGATNSLVGGNVAAARNIISGNNQYGVLINDTQSIGNVVQGNYIGTNAAGTAALPNLLGGVRIANGASFNIIGGSTAATRNIISGNNGDAVTVIGGVGSPSNSNIISGNYIGTNAAGTLALGNNGDGIVIENGSSNVIGGTLAGWGNRIANNNGRGVVVFAATKNRISGNLIYNNFGIGIDLDNDDVTINDNLDPDTGANFLQNFPVLTSARPVGGVRLTGTLNSLPNETFRLEFFASPACDASSHGEGQRFLGRTDVVANGAGIASFTVTFPGTVTNGWAITATATHLVSSNTSEFSRCIRYNLGIPTPVLLANNALTADTTPTLTWSAVTGAASYHLQLATNNTFTLGLVNNTSAVANFTFPTLANGIYYWRVAATDAFGNDGPFSAVRSFTVSNLPLPVLLTPANNATVGDHTPTFTWRAVTGAVSYRIQLSLDPTFTVVLENTAITSLSYTAVGPRLIGDRVYWRVAAIDGAAVEGAFSAARSVVINFVGPTLVSPAHNSTTSNATPTFTWNPVANAVFYRLQISTSSTFTTITQDHLILNSTSLTLPVPLTPGRYYWRVAVKDIGSVNGNFSAVRSFTFGLNTPVLSAPANNATVADTTPTFTWGVVPGTATYRIEISITSDFSIISASGLPSTNNFTPSTPLFPSETYYWRVVALDAHGNTSAPSVVRRVNIGP
jgi:CSLREA domain-containing protein